MKKGEATTREEIKTQTGEDPGPSQSLPLQVEPEFTLEDYNILFSAIGSVKVSLNDPMTQKLMVLQAKIKQKATELAKK